MRKQTDEETDKESQQKEKRGMVLNGELEDDDAYGTVQGDLEGSTKSSKKARRR